MNYIYKNASKKIQHIEFESGGQFLFKGQTITSSEKALDVPDGVFEEQVEKPRAKRSKPQAGEESN